MPDMADLKGLLGSLATAMGGDTGIPTGCQAVKDFDLARYLGLWHEIARLDHSFERGLNRVTAHYAMRDDGGVAVTNRGFNPKDQQWDEAEGKAFFEEDAHTGRFRVSFFGPFYAGYNILWLDENYEHAIVAGPNHGFLWLLARSSSITPEMYKHMLEMARGNGFNTDALIRVSHDMSEA
ncbi:lipocalin family protein [Kushneria marisflavi]|uniref:lipocalin family protein n=1 Tax=Kushneria marisflavi TaxID=157779 RepID=UPI000FF55DE4|nr:lipocalin family protein [Kushneria marisflavi]RKD87530.1 apolipoprotein D and lipocalin family protein [Kushneria marisflavi]